MRKRRFRAPKWAVLVIISAAMLMAIGTAGFGYYGMGSGWYGWDSHSGPLRVGNYDATSMAHDHLYTEPYYRACEGAHCGHLSDHGKLLGLYDCLALRCGGSKLKPYPAPAKPLYRYAPYNCYFAPCSPSLRVTQNTSVDVDVNVNSTANVYGGRGGIVNQNTNVNVDVNVN
jgi:hypothetical protein